ncbi:AAA family ATPase [Brachybacterium sp. FME24]|uniref:AAA family ATPase n=1 Tax=Brachybacterium sp. FME24 TaxID=2742605 RepID=UPI00186931E1|nr:AAA family ATPase [Brachybacterium sp. FME24]
MPPQLTITEDFRSALDLLESGSPLFLTGRAGTGKSTLIRHFLETTARTVLTVAPTGIAALNVEGYTIHRLFSFPLGVSEEMVRGSGYFPGRFATTLASLDTLIIDEASMVRADLFDALAAALERFGPRPGERFGGVQLVLVGDLYQLPPVVRDAEAEYLEHHYGTPYFFSARAFDREHFPVIELGTVFRQVGDDRLVDLLNAVREGTLLEDARAELNARTDPDFDPDLDEFWLTLATTNRIVRSRNRQQLERLPDPAQTVIAQVSGETKGFEHPTEEQLDIAVGAQVMMLNNDPRDRWVNGTLGRITSIGHDQDGPVVEVLLRDGGREQVRPHTWDVTQPVVDGGSLTHQVVGTFTQLPMKLAWAITIHKSQGQTLDRVIVDLTGGTFANGQLYVALSRCTSLEGLVLRRDVLPRDLKSDTRIRRFLHSSSPSDESLGEVYVAALMVGNVGDRYRPRPVEIAVATDDGDEATTIVNPTSDLFAARTQYGITTRDVQLAPVLTEAWAALSPLLAGRVPVGVRIDELLGLIDFELKRHDIVEHMPLGIELTTTALNSGERTGLTAPTALERARAIRDIARRRTAATAGADGTDGTGRGGSVGPGGTAFPQLVRGRGYLLARTSGADGVSGPEGFVVGGNLSAQDDAAQSLAEALDAAWARVLDRDLDVVGRLRAVEAHFGVQILPADLELDGPPDLAGILVPGARVCFTGEVVSTQHGLLDRERMQHLAEQRGLVPVQNVTKTRTDVLVVAERGTQSNKSKNAARWGKPVLDAEEFLVWAHAES